MVEELRLALLGDLQIRRDGVPVEGLRSGKAQALLCYLAATGRPHLRPKLVGLLWGDMPEDSARNNLSKALTYLRKLVGQHLTITRQAVAYDRESPYWLDVEIFEARVNGSSAGASAEGAPSRPDIDQLESAVALYRGDFLEGFYVRQAPDFEEWVLTERARLRELALRALHTIAVYHARRGAAGHAKGIDYTTRLLALEPWREEAHRQLMLLLAYSGQRGAALAQYQVCRRALEEGLGVEPGPETVALYEQIRQGTVGGAEGREAGPVAAVAKARRGDLAVPVAPPPFLSAAAPEARRLRPVVAREGELAQLDGYLDKALDGQGGVVFVTGEAGTGKTALVGELVRRAQAGHVDLIAAGGNCNRLTGSGDPYLPFREILAQLTGDVESRVASGALSLEAARRLWDATPLAARLLADQGVDLIGTLLAASPLMARAAMAAPEATEWRDRLEALTARDGADRVRAGMQQADLCAQVEAVLRGLAAHHPLLLTADDLQWADAGSIELLFHLGRRLSSNRVLLVGIYRPAEVALGRDGERHPLAAVVREFEREFGPIEVPLPQAGDRKFVDSLLDSEPNRLGPPFRQALYGRTKGHALCTVEMLRSMQERGALMRDEVGLWVEGPSVDWASLPAQCEGVIAERIDRLPAALRETLKVAAVEGEAFTAEVVAQVLGAPSYQIVGQLSDELDRRHRLVVGEGSQLLGPGRRLSRYRFRHVLFQDYLYSGLDEAERAYLHEAVGDALAQAHSGQTDPVAVHLARHYEAAGRLDRAVGYYLQAGDQARAIYANAEARQHYARALEALAHLPDTVENRRWRADALMFHAVSSHRSDSPERNLARLARAEQLIRGLPGEDRVRLARVHFRMGRVHHVRGMYHESVRHYQQALAIAQESGDTELEAIVASSLGMAATLEGHYGRAEALLGRAIPLFEQMGNWPEWFQALGYHGIVLVIMGEHAQGMAEILRARAQAQEVNARAQIIQSDFFLAGACVHSGDLPRAMEAAREAVELAGQSGDWLGGFLGRFFESWAAGRAGQYEAAASCAAEAQAIAQEFGERLIRIDWLAAAKAEVSLGLGRVEEAIALAERAVTMAQEMGSITSEGMARRAWGQALAALVPPQWDEAEAQLAESLRLLESGQVRLEAARTREAWGAVCRERGDLAGARAHWERAAAQWEASGLPHELARTRELIASFGQD